MRFEVDHLISYRHDRPGKRDERQIRLRSRAHPGLVWRRGTPVIEPQAAAFSPPGNAAGRHAGGASSTMQVGLHCDGDERA